VSNYQLPRKTNGFAIAGFVLSLLGCTGLLGLIFSAISLSQFKKDPNQDGKALAIAGLIIGIIDVVGPLIWLVAFSATIHSGF
jgi:FtsH-binding integral membrane protein